MSIVIVAIAALITTMILCAVISICACAVSGNYDRSMGEK